DWSYRLLDPRGRDVLARLAVFVGGFSAEQARAICGADRSALAALEDESLLVPRVGTGGAPRIDMLETVREYAHQRLEDGGDGERVREQHAAHCVALAEEADPALAGPAGEDWLARLEDDHANLRAALAWAGQAGALDVELRLVGALARFWELRYLREGRAHLE